MIFGKKQSSQVFSVPKVHTRRKKIWLAIEIIIVSTVFIGSIFTFFWSSNFSTQKALDNLKEFLSLRKQNKVSEGISFEEHARSSIDGKIIKISLLEKSPDGFLIIKDKDGLVVILSPEKDLDTQVRTLQTLLSKAKIEKRTVSLVDFRFEKLVVRYK